MKIDASGRVTIPRRIRERLGLTPGVEVEILLQRGRVILRRLPGHTGRGERLVRALRGRATAKGLTTDQIMNLTRGDGCLPGHVTP